MPATRAFVERLFRPGAEPALVERVAAVGRLTVPVVAINSDRWPTDTKSLGRYGVSAVTMPDAGHFLMMEDPDRFNRLLGAVIEECRGDDRAHRGVLGGRRRPRFWNVL